MLVAVQDIETRNAFRNLELVMLRTYIAHNKIGTYFILGKNEA